VGCPVLRYRTGDLVKVKKGMDAQGNSTFDLIGGILGRTDDMIVVRGVNLYPASVDAVIRNLIKFVSIEFTKKMRVRWLKSKLKWRRNLKLRS
jgi:phenylacetate-coenzyme A ligase PaaK-like adenylate-forming protein